ncbi:MAG: hypothetical protein Q9214_003905 [Letrouitia sp. 1 TL-2023]
MSNCAHLAWLQLSGSPEATIYDEDRLSRILSELGDPCNQTPSLLLFVGQQGKDTALRDIFPSNNLKRSDKRLKGVVNLRVDTTTVHANHPILFADSDPFIVASSSLSSASYCHQIRSYLVGWKATSPANLFDVVHARLLCLFADVICVFCDAAWNEGDVVERLQAWAAAGSASTCSVSIRPRVIIVVEGDQASPTYNLLQIESLHFGLTQQDLSHFFSSITILRLADAQVSSLSRHRRLKEVILRHVDEMRCLRQSSRCLYTAAHLRSFFQMAVQHTAASFLQPFDPILKSRPEADVLPNLDEHLSTFLRLGGLHNVPQVGLVSVIASSILMDAYPPRMHSIPAPPLSVCVIAPSETSFMFPFPAYTHV